MPRRRRSSIPWMRSGDSTIAFILFIISIPVIFFVLYSFGNIFGISMWITVFLFFPIVGFAFLSIVIIAPIVLQNKRFEGIRIANIDVMTGIEFEQYLQKLLAFQGYKVQMTKASGDLGVDLVASRDGDKVAIQAKRYNTKVSRRAISDSVAAMNYYRCNKAMVITNNYFSPGAIALAHSTNCILIDRDILAKWVTELQNKNV